MLNEIVEARYLDRYRVFVRFKDGVEGALDLALFASTPLAPVRGRGQGEGVTRRDRWVRGVAVHNGTDVDQPRNLAKSVTVERGGEVPPSSN